MIFRCAWAKHGRNNVSSMPAAKHQSRQSFIVTLAELPCHSSGGFLDYKIKGQTKLTSVSALFEARDTALEIKPESKLNQPGIVQCLIDYAET
jgi:hypothetical protein